jgi:hypothetical protein
MDYCFNRVISISGSCRNVGKTYLGESIISIFSSDFQMVAIKISKFKHNNHQNDNLKILCKTKYYSIWQELNFSDKDSGRYLEAGAKLSIYIECDDAHLQEAFLFVKNKYCNSCLIVCESASLTKYIKPAISIFVESAYLKTPENKIPCLNRSDLVLKERNIEISIPKLFISVQNYKWVTKYSKNLIYNG